MAPRSSRTAQKPPNPCETLAFAGFVNFCGKRVFRNRHDVNETIAPRDKPPHQAHGKRKRSRGRASNIKAYAFQ
jgi:hypothetical protein